MKIVPDRKHNAFIMDDVEGNPYWHRFSHHAMATIFEIIIYHEDARYAQQASWEAFHELDWLEQNLSRFIENSDISRINSLKINEKVTIGADAFECLKQCMHLYCETGGVFDVSIGALLTCWLDKDKQMRHPTPEEIEAAMQYVGMNKIQLDETLFSVNMLSGPINIDLGGFGKGYAVDKMAELLDEWEVDTFFIHGGTSSVLAKGKFPEKDGWPVSLSSPFTNEKLAVILLKNQALSGSGLQKGQHIIDPRTGYPIKDEKAAWAFAETAALSDALSTAFMIMSHQEIEKYCQQRKDVKALIIPKNKNEPVYYD